jgi:hypothetical protein
MNDVGAEVGPWSPLREDARAGGSGEETRGQCGRGALGGAGELFTVAFREFFDPGGTDGHDKSESNAAQHPSQAHGGHGIGPAGEHCRAGRADGRCGQHDAAASDSVGEGAAYEKCRSDAEDVGGEQDVHGELGKPADVAVHRQQRGEFVSAPRDGAHR